VSKPELGHEENANFGTRLPQGAWRGLFPGMSTIDEIEAAADALPVSQKEELFRFLAARLREAGNGGRQPRAELLAKWRGRTTGAVVQYGGTQAYLNAIRGRDEDGR
jgi:hypothetical protein